MLEERGVPQALVEPHNPVATSQGLLHCVEHADVLSELSRRMLGRSRACSSWGMQKQQWDHPDPYPGAREDLLCDTHWAGDNRSVPGAAGGTPVPSRVVVPFALSSWRGQFVDSSAVTSFGDVSFRSPPVWEPDSSCSAAPVNSGQGMRAAPAVGGESHRGRGTAAGAFPASCSGPCCARVQPWKG